MDERLERELRQRIAVAIGETGKYPLGAPASSWDPWDVREAAVEAVRQLMDSGHLVDGRA